MRTLCLSVSGGNERWKGKGSSCKVAKIGCLLFCGETHVNCTVIMYVVLGSHSVWTGLSIGLCGPADDGTGPGWTVDELEMGYSNEKISLLLLLHLVSVPIYVCMYSQNAFMAELMRFSLATTLPKRWLLSPSLLLVAGHWCYLQIVICTWPTFNSDKSLWAFVSSSSILSSPQIISSLIVVRSTILISNTTDPFLSWFNPIYFH